MAKSLLMMVFAIALLSGCVATVPTASIAESAVAKEFNQPSEGKAGLYVYRDRLFGRGLKRDVWLDGECLGETAPKTFFFIEIEGDTDHVISTESEFSPNDLKLHSKSGQNYFVRQNMRPGFFTLGSSLELVEEDTAKQVIAKFQLATTGSCDRSVR